MINKDYYNSQTIQRYNITDRHASYSASVNRNDLISWSWQFKVCCPGNGAIDWKFHRLNAPIYLNIWHQHIIILIHCSIRTVPNVMNEMATSVCRMKWNENPTHSLRVSCSWTAGFACGESLMSANIKIGLVFIPQSDSIETSLVSV